MTQEMFGLIRTRALEGRTITYREIGDAMGINPQSEVHPHLRVLWKWCDAKGLPHLNGIVVRQDTGLPGAGYTPYGHPVTWAQHEIIKWRVFAYPWKRVRFNPTT